MRTAGRPPRSSSGRAASSASRAGLLRSSHSSSSSSARRFASTASDRLLPENLVRSPGGTVYVLYPRRWFILFLFCLLQVANGIGFIALSPIADVVLRYYGIGDVTVLGANLVDWCSQVFYVVYFGLSPFIMCLLRKAGLRGAAILAALSLGIGGALRLAARHPTQESFYFLFASSVVLAFSTPFLLSATTQLASVWFGEKERGTATAIAVAANQFGLMIGYPLARLIVPAGDVNEGIGLVALNDSEGITLIAIAILAAAFFREKPPTPPGASADDDDDDDDGDGDDHDGEDGEHADLGSGDGSRRRPRSRCCSCCRCGGGGKKGGKIWTVLLSRPGGPVALLSFLLLTVIFGCTCAVLWTMSILLEQQMALEGYDDGQVMLPGTALLFAGMITMPAVGRLLDATHYYRVVSLVLFVGATASCFGVSLFLNHDADDAPGLTANVATLTVLTLLAGGFLSGLQPALLELAAETTHPAPPSESCALLYIVTQAIGLGISLVSAKLDAGGNLFLSCCIGGAAVLFLGFRGEYYRFREEREAKQRQLDEEAALGFHR